MTLTEERPEITGHERPAPAKRRRSWEWLVLALAVVATAGGIALALGGGDGSDTDVSPAVDQVTATDGDHDGIVENGSPTAVDHANATAGGDHDGIIENGSPNAVDDAAEGTQDTDEFLPGSRHMPTS